MPTTPSLVSTPLLDDQPASVDLLNFEQYAAALREVVLNPQTRTPFVIGIFGRWGTGKTTLMRMVENELLPRNLATVWFSAWPYAQEQEIWAAFLQALTIRLTERLGFCDKFRLSARMFRRSLAWDRLLYEAPRTLLSAMLVAVPAAVGALLAATATDTVGRLVGSASLAGSAGLALWYVARAGAAALREGVRPDFTLYRSADFERHVGFLERFRMQFAQIVQALPRSRGRLVVFIDDLDRCSPEKALQLLDAIKVFVDVPGCIFVLGVDASVMQRALAAKYPEDLHAQREYLGKIVQLAFHLPPLTQGEMGTYIRHLNVTFPDERCREVFISALAQNPREIKRVINSYSLHWHLAEAASAQLDPVRLAKVVVIQQTFSPLFAVLREQPEWLGMLERAILARAGMALEVEPEIATEVTMIRGPSAESVPPALTPFLAEPALERLFALHCPRSPQEQGAGFAYLSTAEAAHYFTLTRRIAPGPEGAPTSRAAPDGLASLSPAPPSRPMDGSKLDSGYRIIRPLGSGGAGDVLLAEDRVVGRQVAIKRLAATLAGTPEWTARFLREMELMSRLGPHPNIVSILDAHPGGDARDPPYYVMEHVIGETLRAMLDRKRLELNEARSILTPIFDALEHAHRAGILHRDIKPSAIVVTPQGEPKLLDFSLAIEAGDGVDSLTATGTVIGTPAYMSPEQLRNEPLDARSDLFSFGLVIYEALTAEKAFDGGFGVLMHKILNEEPPAPSALLPWATPKLDRFMARMLAKSSEARYHDAAEAKAAFLEAFEKPANDSFP